MFSSQEGLLLCHDFEDSHEVSNIDLTVAVEVGLSIVAVACHYFEHGYCIGDVHLAVAVEVALNTVESIAGSDGLVLVPAGDDVAAQSLRTAGCNIEVVGIVECQAGDAALRRNASDRL